MNATLAGTSPRWAHTHDVWSWQEVARGTTLGHVFAGSLTTLVSTRISEAGLANVLNGSAKWNSLEPGATVSQLVLQGTDGASWGVAFVAERRPYVELAGAPEDASPNELDVVSFYLVASDGTIDASAQAICASCHSQRHH